MNEIQPQSNGKAADPDVTPDRNAGEESSLEGADGPRVRLAIEDALPIMEQSVKSLGIPVDRLLERVKLDGCVCTDHMEVFNLVNVYFGTGLLHDDGKPRQMIAVGVDRAFDLDSVWAHVAFQLGRGELVAEGAREYIDKTIAERIGAEAPHRGAEAFHLSVWISPIELVQSSDRAKAFLESVHGLVDALDVLSENYGVTFAIFCPLPETVLPEHIHDTIVSMNGGGAIQ